MSHLSVTHALTIALLFNEITLNFCIIKCNQIFAFLSSRFDVGLMMANYDYGYDYGFHYNILTLSITFKLNLPFLKRKLLLILTPKYWSNKDNHFGQR